jgi:hypothetical protein
MKLAKKRKDIRRMRTIISQHVYAQGPMTVNQFVKLTANPLQIFRAPKPIVFAALG